MTRRIDFLENYEVNLRRRKQISVNSLDLKNKLIEWIATNTPEQTCKLLGISLVNVLDKNGLEDFILYIIKIDRPDLMHVILNAGDISTLYCIDDLNKYYQKARSNNMKKIINEKIRSSENDDPY